MHIIGPHHQRALVTNKLRGDGHEMPLHLKPSTPLPPLLPLSPALPYTPPPPGTYSPPSQARSQVFDCGVFLEQQRPPEPVVALPAYTYNLHLEFFTGARARVDGNIKCLKCWASGGTKAADARAIAGTGSEAYDCAIAIRGHLREALLMLTHPANPRRGGLRILHSFGPGTAGWKWSRTVV